MKLYGDDYYTVIARNLDEAKEFLLRHGHTDAEFIDEVREIDPDEHEMCVPIEDLPDEYHDKDKYTRSNWNGIYEGVYMSLREAMRHTKEKPPCILCVSDC